MATKTKIEPHVAAQAKVNDLIEQERAASVRQDAARAHLADLRSRNQSGDDTITGAMLTEAKGEVERTEGLAANAARLLAEARMDAADALALYTAHEVRKALVVHDTDKAVLQAQERVQEALTGLEDALARRDTESDTAGRALAEAGIPPNRWINGVMYRRVGRWETDRPIPGAYNVFVRADDGAEVALSGTGTVRNLDREVRTTVLGMLGGMLRRYGLDLRPGRTMTAA